MSLNFPADPIANPTYEAPNGVTYIWNDSIQSWVVQSVTYDNDYVNITGDTMTGNLNFAYKQISINWAGNPKILFKSDGFTELRGNAAAAGLFVCKNVLRLSNNTAEIQHKSDTRLKFTSGESVLVFADQELLKVNASGVEYHGNFTQDKNVVTVEYVTTEVTSLQDQIDDITNDLDTIIEDLIDQKAVLLQGNQTVMGNKIFKDKIEVRSVIGASGQSDIYPIRVSDSNQNRFFWITQRGTVHSQTKETLNNSGWPATSADTQLINKKFADDTYLKTVSGTAGESDDSGVRVAAKSDGNQQISVVKASISQYGVNVRGLLPQGNTDPSNSSLKLGQMYLNTSSKRVFIRVS